MSASATQPGDRFTAIFTAFMVFCVLVWLWGLGLFMLWPWQKGGDWLPDYPLAVTCADGSACALPVGELPKAKAEGRIKSVTPPETSGETFYELITVQWQAHAIGIESKASAWNFQTKVRYRIAEDTPVLVEYQEIGGKVFLYAVLGALVSLGLLYLRKLSK